MTILGESGIGKTRLADEVVAGLGDDVLVLTGRSRSYADEATFAPAAAIVADLAGVDEDDDATIAHRKLHALLDEHGGGPGADAIVDRLTLLLERVDRRDESAYVSDVHVGFLGLIDTLASARPVVLLFDDAHTLKPPMLDLIERLGVRAHDGRRQAMILALGRADLLRDRPTWASHAANAVLLRLDPLTNAESVDLVRKAAGGRIADESATTIAERAGGNPFFIIESTGMLLPAPAPASPTAGRCRPPSARSSLRGSTPCRRACATWRGAPRCSSSRSTSTSSARSTPTSPSTRSSSSSRPRSSSATPARGPRTGACATRP